ncbi:hypothetical protein SDC9_89375 [bioreactor metagenome]|uniref:Uncharacterized protein n=1 Tax=bioreactor metagenome TaxID=1076179 RepID=A0A644ZPL9_9ZZZZ
MYQSLRASSAPSLNLGGTNPSQVGLGVSVQGINVNMNQGSLQPTGRPYDLALDGRGYFIVAKGPIEGKINVNTDNFSISSENMETYFTRDGAFKLDPSGNLLSSNGYRIMGYKVKDLNENSQTGDLTLKDAITKANIEKDILKKLEADAKPYNEKIVKAQQEVDNIQTNLDAIKKELSLAEEELKKATTAKTNADNALTADPSNQTLKDAADKAQQAFDTASQKKTELDTKVGELGGKLSDANTALDNAKKDPTLQGINDKILDAQGKVNVAVKNVEKLDDFYDANSTNLAATHGELEALKIPETVNKGGELFRIQSFSVEKDGLIKAVLSDGSTTILGQVAMAAFNNEIGLEQVGQNMYIPSTNSGEAIVRTGKGMDPLKDNGKAYGDMIQGSLEMSNVDLAVQFTDMIIASRSFQANSKIITTGDEILQELVNLKR